MVQPTSTPPMEAESDPKPEGFFGGLIKGVVEKFLGPKAPVEGDDVDAEPPSLVTLVDQEPDKPSLVTLAAPEDHEDVAVVINAWDRMNVRLCLKCDVLTCAIHRTLFHRTPAVATRSFVNAR